MESLRTVNTWQLSSRATLSLLFVILFLAIGNVRASHSMSASSTLAPPFQGWLVLDGGDDYALAEDHSELDVGDEPGESLTIEAWVNFQTFGNAKIATKFAYGDSAYGLYTESMYQYPYNYRCLVGELWWQGGGLQLYHCATQYGGEFWVPGWHHVALVLDGTSERASLYMDGERKLGPSNVSAPLRNSAAPLKMGNTLNGVMDEMRISNVARYTDSTYTVPTSPSACDEHTRALWHYDEFEGATIFHDVCGADNFLIGYNGAHTEGVPIHKVYLPIILK